MAADNPIERIAARFGNVTEMAREIGMSQPAVWEWVQKGVVPSKRIPEVIEVALSMKPPIILEPNDFFPPQYSKMYREHRMRRRRRKSS